MNADMLSKDGIIHYLKKQTTNKITVDVRKCIDSTNKAAKILAADGGKEGYLIISESQTQGRGRLGRSFFSPEGSGIYMSLILKPSISPENATLITTAAAVSVCIALERLGVEKPQIKWVNDIFVNGKKVCGILTEGSIDGSGKLNFAVLGVGINIYAPDKGFPCELQNIAGGVFESKKENLRNKFTAYFLESFFEYYENLLSREYITEYEKRCFTIGENVSFIKNGGEVTANAVGIDENCGLKVVFANGETEVLSTGEVTVKLKKQ